jgi:DNA modification methylase
MVDIMVNIHLINADSQHIPLKSESVHCVVTSPPYYGLRNYAAPDVAFGGNWTGQLGLEPTPELYLDHMVEIFREVRRVMRDDGTLWLNMGDSYAGSGCGPTTASTGLRGARTQSIAGPGAAWVNRSKTTTGYKPKDLMMMPHRLAMALQSDGWWVRSTIIWHKPNAMPESVQDRPTTDFEYVFLLSKRERYYYDADAIREPMIYPDAADGTRIFGGANKHGANAKQKRTTGRAYTSAPSGRNKRTVWTISTKPYSGAHFASFPPDLVEPCVKAGTSNHGVCPVCGAPWAQSTVQGEVTYSDGGNRKRANAPGAITSPKSVFVTGIIRSKNTVGFAPTCDHDAVPVPATVLDPFGGTGVTALVANALGRRGISLDISHEYSEMARKRTEVEAFDAWINGASNNSNEEKYEDLPLFNFEAI